MQEIELANEPSSLAIARTFVGDYLEEVGVPESEAFDILLALNEAVANAHRHGRRGSRGRITVRCGMENGMLAFLVADDGSGFDYHDEMKQMPDPLQASGRGLYLMNELMDRMEVRSGSRGTTVALETRAPVSVSS